MDNKQAILGFTEFFKGITGNQNLEIPSEIAEKCGIQAQADGEYITQSAGDEIRQKNYDLISRRAVLEAIDVKAWEFCDYLISNGRNDEQKPVSHFADNLRECVREELPSVKQEPKTEQFAKWVASEIFDEWEYNKDSFAEIACRKLEKLGIVRAKGDEWELVEPQESEDKE